MKVTSTKCIDGKRHNWQEIVWEKEGVNTRGYSWCSKCGSTTEFFNNRRCLPFDKKDIKKYGKYYIRVPKYLEKDKG